MAVYFTVKALLISLIYKHWHRTWTFYFVIELRAYICVTKTGFCRLDMLSFLCNVTSISCSNQNPNGRITQYSGFYKSPVHSVSAFLLHSCIFHSNLNPCQYLYYDDMGRAHHELGLCSLPVYLWAPLSFLHFISYLEWSHCVNELLYFFCLWFSNGTSVTSKLHIPYCILNHMILSEYQLPWTPTHSSSLATLCLSSLLCFDYTEILIFLPWCIFSLYSHLDFSLF